METVVFNAIPIEVGLGYTFSLLSLFLFFWGDEGRREATWPLVLWQGRAGLAKFVPHNAVDQNKIKVGIGNLRVERCSSAKYGV